MAQSEIYMSEYRPQFSGHETFPLRYGWLKKAYDAVSSNLAQSKQNPVFSGEDAIARFGVGKNMVSSIRHWASAAGIIESPSASESTPTQLGELLFNSAEGVDPFMESPSTAWLIHWNLASHSEKTTWYYAFNHFNSTTFEREHLVSSLERLSKDRSWTRASTSTIKRDVDCFLRSYVVRTNTRSNSHEDSLECPLAELGLIKPIGRRDGFRFARGVKSTLSDEIFLFALTDFWERFTSASTLSFETLAYEPGSPGRAFLLDENELVERLLEIEDVSLGAFRWSETAGLKQVVRTVDLTPEVAFGFIELAYPNSDSKRAA